MNTETYLFVSMTIAPMLTPVLAYLIGGIPFAYIIVRRVTGTDITVHGTGNVGAMNVRRATGSWTWFVVAMVADALKGLIPVLAAKLAVSGLPLDALSALSPWTHRIETLHIAGISTTGPWISTAAFWVPMLAVAGTVIGHNYSLWMAVIHGRFARTGKGLATGGGALLAYDWRYFLAALIVGLAVIGLTRYMMAGQVAAAAALPAAAILLGSADWPFALFMGLVVYAAHHRRFVGLLRGQEPRLYVNDAMGPRG
ncbi:MAG: glycerol-3-phosphate acyltransferase [Actinomycetota bacterium]|nr:glycerol-3-phosphate acyltransferase [Actinomycetota bacterium]MDZ4180980.1 glycerol-3-phosphate acyltransferase [Coriobacteriia bacterium]